MIGPKHFESKVSLKAVYKSNVQFGYAKLQGPETTRLNDNWFTWWSWKLTRRRWLIGLRLATDSNWRKNPAVQGNECLQRQSYVFTQLCFSHLSSLLNAGFQQLCHSAAYGEVLLMSQCCFSRTLFIHEIAVERCILCLYNRQTSYLYMEE